MNIAPNLNVEALIRINKLEGEVFSLKGICLILGAVVVIIAIGYVVQSIWVTDSIKKDIKEIKKGQALLFVEIRRDRNQGMAQRLARSTRPPILIC